MIMLLKKKNRYNFKYGSKCFFSFSLGSCFMGQSFHAFFLGGSPSLHTFREQRTEEVSAT
jgi:hypothetical protein